MITPFFRNPSRQISLLLLATTLLSGCNVFSVVDKPSGDEQALSAARACLDDGDFECARKYYAELSNEYADIRESEEAFMILAENGATMGAFMETFGSGGSGQALSNLAEKMAPGSLTKRQNVQQAFQKYPSISSANAPLQALVRFVGAVALAAEFLAEELTTSGTTLNPNKIASNGASCLAAGLGGCAVNAACGAPSGAVLGTGASAPNFLTTALSGTIDLGHFKQAMTEMNNALTALAAAGKFSNGAGGLSNSILGLTLDVNSSTQRCFRYTMLSLGIGR
jgi:hypothetical protein